jgi:hypothetical protein
VTVSWSLPALCGGEVAAAGSARVDVPQLRGAAVAGAPRAIANVVSAVAAALTALHPCSVRPGSRSAPAATAAAAAAALRALPGLRRLRLESSDVPEGAEATSALAPNCQH